MNNYMMDILKAIMAIDSPSGYTKKVTEFCKTEAESLGYKTEYNKTTD